MPSGYSARRPRPDVIAMMARLLTTQDFRAYAIELFSLTWGAEPSPGQLAKLHQPRDPCRECDLLCAVEGWLRHIEDLDGVDWTQKIARSELLRDLEREAI